MGFAVKAMFQGSPGKHTNIQISAEAIYQYTYFHEEYTNIQISNCQYTYFFTNIQYTDFGGSTPYRWKHIGFSNFLEIPQIMFEMVPNGHIWSYVSVYVVNPFEVSSNVVGILSRTKN